MTGGVFDCLTERDVRMKKSVRILCLIIALLFVAGALLMTFITVL